MEEPVEDIDAHIARGQDVTHVFTSISDSEITDALNL